MLRERIPMLSAMTLDQLGARMKCDKCGKRPERYYPANQSNTPGFVQSLRWELKMIKPSLFVVFEGQTEGELDSKQNDWLSARENQTHVIKITDEHLTAEMSAPSIRHAPISSPHRFLRSIEYHE
jgi:hypothetical protein